MIIMKAHSRQRFKARADVVWKSETDTVELVVEGQGRSLTAGPFVTLGVAFRDRYALANCTTFSARKFAEELVRACEKAESVKAELVR